jgi:hypothetical protein
LTENIVTEDIAAEPPQDAAAVGEALAGWLRDNLWMEGPHIGSTGPRGSVWGLLYEDNFSQEDYAAPGDTAIIGTADGRYWHATITVTVVEQTVRTPHVDAWDAVEGDDEQGGGES